MGPGGHVLLDHGVALGPEAGQEHGTLHLGARHRSAVGDAVELTAPHGQRGQPAAVPALDGGSHPPERHGDPVHGPPGDRLVAGQDGEEREGRAEPGEETDGRTRVAHVDHVRAVPAASRPRRRRRRPRPSVAAPKASIAPRVPVTSAPSERPSMRDRPSASAARRSARWEIDLSPGMRSRPRSGPDGPTVRLATTRAPADGTRRSRARRGRRATGPAPWPRRSG